VVNKKLKIKNFYHMVNYILFFIRIISLFDSVFIFKIRIGFSLQLYNHKIKIIKFGQMVFIEYMKFFNNRFRNVCNYNKNI